MQRHPSWLLLHHDLQKVELSWPLGGLICRLCSDVCAQKTKLTILSSHETIEIWFTKQLNIYVLGLVLDYVSDLCFCEQPKMSRK